MKYKKQSKPEIDKQTLSQQRQSAVSAIRWSWFDTIGYTPHRWQICFHNSWTLELLQYVTDNNISLQDSYGLTRPARHRTVVAGRRGGKSESSGHEGSLYMIAGPYRVMIGCPSYDLGYNEFKVIRDDLMNEDSPVNIVDLGDNKEGGNLHILTDIGSECTVVSFDKPKKSGHGQEYDLIILSETGLMDNIGGEDGVWNKTLVGAMATRVAETIAPTTPQGRDDWLFPRFMRGCDPSPVHGAGALWRSRYAISDKEYPYDPDYLSLCWPAYANVVGFNENVEKLRSELPPRIFQEQVLGWFVKWSGAIWINDFCFDPHIHIIDSFDVPSWWNRIEVIDPGYSGLFAWIAAVIDPKGDLFIVDEYSANRTGYEQHVKDIEDRRKAFYKSDYDPNRWIPIYVDPEDPRTIDTLNSMGLKCIAADNEVISGFQQGAFRFSHGSLSIFRNCKQVGDALKYHEWAKQTGEAAKRKEANDKWKHFSDTVRYLCNAPIWASETPVEKEMLKEGWKAFDMMRSIGRNVGIGDMGYQDWEMLHG